MCLSVVPNPVQLDNTSQTNKAVNCSQRVVDGDDDQRVAYPDRTGSCQSEILGNGQLLGWPLQITDTSCYETPLHQWSPEEDSLGACWMVHEPLEAGARRG